MIIIYDDSLPAPEAVRQIIGSDRFGDIIRRKQRLGAMIEKIVAEQPGFRFVRIGTESDRLAQIEALERIGGDDLRFRIPSCLMPVDLDKLRETLRKLPYAPGPAIFGGRFEDEAVTLMRPEDISALLRIGDARERRAYLAAFADDALPVDNQMRLVDLRDVRSFLAYMTGATEARAFNAIDVSHGIFRKRSAMKEKMRGEHAFFHIVPDTMKRFLLPTFDWQEDADSASYAMEYLSIPDAAIQVVHHSFDSVGFDRLLDSFFDFLGTRATKDTAPDAVRDRARSDILGKMHQRLTAFRKTHACPTIDGLLQTSGFGGLDALEARATVLIEAAIAADKSAALAVGHGDPCLSNILFHQSIGIFRLIDPRGATSLDAAFQHPLYDVAKFSHSILGNYDFVNNGLFECRVDEELGLRLDVDGGGIPAWMRTAFLDRCGRAGYEMRVVRAYELSLFLSMLPLHIDVPRKLVAFTLIAASIIAELEATG